MSWCIPCGICKTQEDVHWFPRAYMWCNLAESDYSNSEEAPSGSFPLCSTCARTLDFRRAVFAAINTGLVQFTALGEVVYKENG